MDIEDFFARLLGLNPPWRVDGVSVKEEAEKIDIHLECSRAVESACPFCGRVFPVIDFSSGKKWRHPDTGGLSTLLHCRLPVVDCPEHGKQTANPPWGDAESPLSFAFEQSVSRLAGELGDIRKAARCLRLDGAALRRMARLAAGASGEKANEQPTTRPRKSSKPSAPPPVRQASFFEQNDMSYANRGIAAFRALDLDKAVEYLETHRKLFPKGHDVGARLAAAEFLRDGLRKIPDDCRDRAACLCRLWSSFEEYAELEQGGGRAYVAETKAAFFSRVIEAIEACPEGASTLPPAMSTGYVLLQAGRLQDAVQALQADIARNPHLAMLHGYLGDAWWLLGKTKTARQCYREACLIDPTAIDWRHVRDTHLRELREELLFVHGSDPELAVAWLPSHARMDGLFERREVRLHDGLKEMVEEYLLLNKAFLKEESALLGAKLFFRGMVLCENEESLRFVKKVDLVQVRRTMKQVNPDLFAEFLDWIEAGAGR